MRIASVRVAEFKSLSEIGLDLGAFTVITGPNGAGKSNLVDAINFLGEVYSLGLEQAVVRNGGLGNMVRAQNFEPEPLVFSVTAVIDRADLDEFQQNAPKGAWASNQVAEFGLIYHHRFVLELDDDGEFGIRADVIEFADRSGRELVRLGYEDPIVDGRYQGRSGDVEHRQVQPRLQPNRMLRELLGPLADREFANFAPSRRNLGAALLIESLNVGQALPYIKRGVGGIRLFQLSPFQCRKPSVATPNAILDRYGENLPAAGFHLQRRDARAWSLVEAGMESIFPEIEAISFVPTPDRKLTVEFHDPSLQRSWSASEVSDGTIQTFALLVALYDKRSPVFMVEEPENSVHPWILRQFIDLCRAEPEKQTLLTTHSPVVLNYVASREVYLMSARDGHSSIRLLVDDAGASRQLLADGEIDLFDLYDSGSIPTSVPRGLGQEGFDDAD